MNRKKLSKRILSLFAVSTLTVGSLTGCGGTDEGNGGKLVKVAIVVSNATPAGIAMQEVFEPMVEELTEGRYDVKLYPSGVLGAEKNTYDYTKSGIVEMTVVGTSMWSESPKMATPDIPFLFKDVEHARRCYQGELGDYIREDIESSQPLKLLAWMPNGARAFSSNKPLTSLEEFKGLKLRMPNNPIHIKLAEGLGASAVIMDMGEVFTALEQGVVDGQDNPLSTVKNEGWYEVQKYIYNTNHIISSLELFTGTEFWNGLSEEDQDAFMKAAEAASDYAWELYIEQLDSDKKFMEENGLTVTEPTEEEKAKMKELAQPVYDYLRGQYDWFDEDLELVNSIE